jgi:hypothetical protein
MVRSELRITIRSGELTVGLLSRSTRGPVTWSWILNGVGCPNDDKVFIWHSNGPVSNRSRRFNAGALRRNADAVVIAGDHRARSAVH